MHIKTPAMQLREGTTGFPAISDCSTLKMWFKAEESTGDTTITDAVGSLTIPVSTCTRLSNGFGLDVATTGNQSISGGSWPTVGSSDFIVVSSCKMATTDLFLMGSGTAATRIQIAVNGGFGSHVEDSSDQDYTVQGHTNGTAESYVLTFDESVEMACHVGSYAQTATDSLTVPDVAAISGIADSSSVDITEMYGIALFVFTGGLPVGAIGDCLWMADQWRSGNKVLHPNCANWT